METVRLEGFDLSKSPRQAAALGPMFASSLFGSGATAPAAAASAPPSGILTDTRGLTDLDLEFEQSLNTYINQFGHSNDDHQPSSAQCDAGPAAAAAGAAEQPVSATMTPAMMLPSYMSTLSMHTPPVTSSAADSPAAVEYAFPRSTSQHRHHDSTPHRAAPAAPADTFKDPNRSVSRERTGRASSIGKAPTARQRSRSARRSAASAYATPAAHAEAASSSSTASAGIATNSSINAAGSTSAIPLNYIESNHSPWLGYSHAQAIAIKNAQPDYHHQLSRDNEYGWTPSESGSTSASTSVVSSVPQLSSSRRSRILTNVAEESSSLQQSPPQPPAPIKSSAISDKKKRRRESHNAVERRRRDNINERISELATLLPALLLEEPPSANGSRAKEKDEDDAPGSPEPAPSLPFPALSNSPSLTMAPMPSRVAPKPNKGTVLTRSVEYIRYLQQIVQLHVQRNAELEQTIELLRNSNGSSNAALNLGHTIPAMPPHMRTQYDLHGGSGFSSSAASVSGEHDSSLSPEDNLARHDEGEETSRGRSSNPVAPRTGRSNPRQQQQPRQQQEQQVTTGLTPGESDLVGDFAEQPFDELDWMDETKPFATPFDGHPDSTRATMSF